MDQGQIQIMQKFEIFSMEIKLIHSNNTRQYDSSLERDKIFVVGPDKKKQFEKFVTSFE